MGELDGDVDWVVPFAGVDEDRDVIERVLPDGCEEAARCTRSFKGTAPLLRSLQIYLAGDYPLRDTEVHADVGNLIRVSDKLMRRRQQGSAASSGSCG